MEGRGVSWKPLQPRGGPLLLLPGDSVAFLAPFAPLFSQPLWRHAQGLLVRAILAPGRRIVSTVLHAVGLSHLPSFHTHHRRLSPALSSTFSPCPLLRRLP